MGDELIDQTYVHLVVDDNTANLLRETLRLVGRNEEVIAVSDALAMGPLTDVDERATCRVEWWMRLGSTDLEELEKDVDDRAVWEGLRNDPRDVMLWSSAHPDEHLFALRACWHLRDYPMRVHEVVMTKKLYPRVSDAFARLGILGPKAGVAHWSDRARVVDVEERAKRWEAIRSREGDWLRELHDGQIVHLAVDAYDAKVVAACSKDWTDSIRALGSVLADLPVALSLLIWRIHTLVRDSVLEARGPTNRLGMPSELKAKGVTA